MMWPLKDKQKMQLYVGELLEQCSQVFTSNMVYVPQSRKLIVKSTAELNASNAQSYQL